MRIWSLLLIGVSAISLTACSSLGFESGKKAESTPTAAAKAVSVSSAASAQEEKEMAGVMGASETTPTADETAPVDEAPVEIAEVNAKPAENDFVPGVPDGCPAVEVLPDTKSITYFDDKEGRPVGEIMARASLTDVRGGCEYSDNSVVVDIDMLMQGRISDKGRYEGRRDLEAFMTFPYFVAVMDPDGKLIDKKIMATAMRFKPEVDDLDHAEKITQTIPLKDIGAGSKYTITLGFQLNRQQLDYNRGVISDKKNDHPPVLNATPAPTPEKKTEAKVEKKAEVKDETPPEVPMTKTTVKDTPTPSAKADNQTKSSSSPAPAKSSKSKMSPILE